MKIDEQGLLQAWPFLLFHTWCPSLVCWFCTGARKGRGRGRARAGAAAMPLPGSLILYLQEKEEEGEAWYAPSLVLCFFTCKGGGGRGLQCPSLALLLRELWCASDISCCMNRTEHKGTCWPLPLNFAIVRWRQINKSMKFFGKKKKKTSTYGLSSLLCQMIKSRLPFTLLLIFFRTILPS
jgi:hypothetical protein